MYILLLIYILFKKKFSDVSNIDVAVHEYAISRLLCVYIGLPLKYYYIRWRIYKKTFGGVE